MRSFGGDASIGKSRPEPGGRQRRRSISDQTLQFEALITPHRSLSPRAWRVLLSAICGLCGISAGVFVWLGAWPVGGFTGIELGLAAFLFRLNIRAGRASELIMLTGEGMRIIRTDPDGRQVAVRLAPAWMTLRLEDRPGRVPALLLVSRGRRHEIARSLGEIEKRALAEALEEALHRWRNPRFDNPQLRTPLA